MNSNLASVRENIRHDLIKTAQLYYSRLILYSNDDTYELSKRIMPFIIKELGHTNLKTTLDCLIVLGQISGE